MSGHADTIRRFIKAGVGTPGHQDRLDAATALDALVADNQQLRGALDGLLDVANRARSGERVGAVEWYAATEAAHALAGTASEDTG